MKIWKGDDEIGLSINLSVQDWKVIYNSLQPGVLRYGRMKTIIAAEIKRLKGGKK